MRTLSFMTMILIVSTISGQQRLTEAISLYNESKKLYQKDDFSGHLEKSLEAHALLPFSRAIKYNLAVSHAINNQFEESFLIIDELIAVDTRIAFDADSVFSELKKTPEYPIYIGKSRQMNAEVVKSEVAFELDQIDLHPESIAFSKETGLFYISSMRKRKIVTYDPETSQVKDWITSEEIRDLYGVMGMKISGDGQSIWFCSSPLPQMEGYESDGQYTPSVFKVNLTDKKQLNRFALPIGSVPGDLTIGPNGACYVSDSAHPRIFRIESKHAKLFFDGQEQLVNLQGLTLEGNYLFIADYLLGIHRLNITDMTLTLIEIESPNNTAGVDGLYYFDNSLITIQNGVYPFRIGRYFLENDLKVVKVEYYDKGADFLDEPTLGLINDDELYFVANSPWGYYDGNDILLEYLKKPQIRKVKISN